MYCKRAKYEPDEGRYYCEVSGDQCIYLIPNRKRCAEEYGEDPDAEREETDDDTLRIKKVCEVIENLRELKVEIVCLKKKEAENRDNIPENLIGSEQYEIADKTCIYLELALHSLDDVVDFLNDAIF